MYTRCIYKTLLKNYNLKGEPIKSTIEWSSLIPRVQDHSKIKISLHNWNLHTIKSEIIPLPPHYIRQNWAMFQANELAWLPK